MYIYFPELESGYRVSSKRATAAEKNSVDSGRSFPTAVAGHAECCLSALRDFLAKTSQWICDFGSLTGFANTSLSVELAGFSTFPIGFHDLIRRGSLHVDSSRGRDHSQFMSWCAIDGIDAPHTAKKRTRNPRVTAYLEPSEYSVFQAYAKRHRCDASHVVRQAILGLLKKEDPADTATKLEVESQHEALRLIVVRATELLQQDQWSALVVPPEQPLERHYDATQLHDALMQLVRRVAELMDEKKNERTSRKKGVKSDASLPETHDPQ